MVRNPNSPLPNELLGKLLHWSWLKLMSFHKARFLTMFNHDIDANTYCCSMWLVFMKKKGQMLERRNRSRSQSQSHNFWTPLFMDLSLITKVGVYHIRSYILFLLLHRLYLESTDYPESQLYCHTLYILLLSPTLSRINRLF